MKEIKLSELEENPVKLIRDDWMLVTSGTRGAYNTMTASWGGVGELWGKDVAFIFLRPQRYTFEFAEKNDRMTLSFFDETYRDALKLCGSKSGRDVDKAKETGLIPVFENNTTYFSQANIVLQCRKMACMDLDPKDFLDASIEKWYAAKDYHRMYIAEIERVLIKEA